MAKQLLIYETITPINKNKHSDLCIKATNKYEFASGVNSVPITAIEFPNAATCFSLVFAGEGDAMMPVAIMGLRDQENLFIKDDGVFEGDYIPAYLRRYPFVFSTADDGKNFTLCIDESANACNTEGKGERLFDSNGEQTVYLGNVLNFLKEYQAHFNRTKLFCQKLQKLDLLQPMGARLSNQGKNFTLTGFQVINREKLQQLAPGDLAELSKTGELELAYTHLSSLNNLNRLARRLDVQSDDAAVQPSQTEDVPEIS